MHRFLACLLVCFSAPLCAQSITQVPSQQCVWHAGDDLAWSAASLDETGWKPLATWKVTADQPWAWIRCHANLLSLQQASHPALEVKTARAYQLFLNGSLVAQNGNLSNGDASMNPEQIFSVAQGDLARSTDTIALRITSRISIGLTGTEVTPPAFDAGETEWLRARHNGQAFAGFMRYLPVAIGFGIIGVLGFVVFALYLNDRSRRELLLLSFICWALTTIRLCEIARATMTPWPSTVAWLVYALSQSVAIVEIWFMFLLARRKVPLVYKILAALTLPVMIMFFSNAFFPLHISLWVDSIWEKWAPIYLIVIALGGTAPFAAFWPWRRIPRGTRALAVCAMSWATFDILWLVAGAVSQSIRGTVDTSWQPVLLELRAFGTLSAIIALIALLFRDQRRTAEERAVLAGEMQAAQQIQRILAPNELPCAPGLSINVAFQPMREVGGDFYLCRVLADGRQRILLGDVSGKGTAAAMTAALLLGGAEDHEELPPGELLSHLNRVLRESRVGGFATCLCADFDADGNVTFANAGHLPPYRAGEELPSASALPLGIDASEQACYEETSFNLEPGDTLTFLSDGVVEARNSSGELFGFDRACAISDQSAEQIARAAQDFGQEDDITVLTLTFAPAEVLLT